jgi:hypothetical protein
MNRRTAIRQVVFISAGAVLLPSCMTDDKPSLVLKNIPLTGAQEKMLAALSETIIPKTGSFIGAGDLKAHQFVLTMIDDCTSPQDQQKFNAGMTLFEEGCKKKTGHSFIKCSPQEKNEWLQTFEKKIDAPAEAIAFYEMTKRYTVQSFTSSKEYMTTVRNYKMVPGNNYKGCVPVT